VLRQEELEFKASVGYVVRFCLKKKAPKSLPNSNRKPQQQDLYQKETAVVEYKEKLANQASERTGTKTLPGPSAKVSGL
jgi:hypothetical protein